MAPEYSGFGGVGVLAMVAGVLAVSLIMLQPSRRIADVHLAASRLRANRIVLAVTLVGLGASVWQVRQAYFLDEPMAIAAGGGDKATVVRLLSEGASPNAYGVDSVSPALVDAVREGHQDIALLLLSRGADPNLEDNSGATALSLARSKNERELERALLAAGARN